MSLKNTLALICFTAAVFTASLQAQVSADVRNAWVRSFANGAELENAFAGGLNNPQWSIVDLNHDGIPDLFIFERIGAGLIGTNLPFVNTGTAGQPNYIYAPEYESRFPDVANFMLLRDYDGDGIADIFCYTPQTFAHSYGIKVMKGYYDNQNKIAFRTIKDPILFTPFTGAVQSINVLDGDLPAIEDIDGDGDLDILNFELSGSYMQYYVNQSVELGYNRDSMIFRLADDCWGIINPAMKEPNKA